ncbi:hypothetical protein [Nocardiopsis sp. YSL2]|uniref:hypothetical protein n=1 Tax=Nocardiopsis sp. YSL2 TaxID=2939492 RepID=UPI0026F42144|nr:hypothetical protein [Nocardiopsis sp. YSL2]
MGHRHPSQLKNPDIAHARARWLLRAELAGCEECRSEGDRDALADLTEGGVFDSLLTGFILARVPQWFTPGHPQTYPATAHGLAPVDERDFWHSPTQDCLRVCTVDKRGKDVDTRPALRALRLMPSVHRTLVLDDVIDGLSESEV